MTNSEQRCRKNFVRRLLYRESAPNEPPGFEIGPVDLIANYVALTSLPELFSLQHESWISHVSFDESSSTLRYTISKNKAHL